MSEAKGKKGPSSEVCGNCLEPEGSAKVSKLSACARCGLVLYCSRDCQRAHWKANHKQRCVAKADRVPQQQDTSGARIGDNASSNTAATGEKCSICLDPLADSSATTLQCTHMFHAACLAELRLLGIKQACPLCRTPLLQEGGAEQLNEEAAEHYVVPFQLVKRGKATWSTLPAEAQLDLETAVTKWCAAAEQGCAEAQCALGHLYENGHGVTQSDDEAVKWYTEATKQEDMAAQYNLGNLYFEGRGVAQNIEAGVSWYRKAAEQGHGVAQFALGMLFDSGLGVAKSDSEAARWWSKAAEQGHVEAQCYLGIMYYRGTGVAQSDAEAVRWWQRAAKQGDKEAQYRLRKQYEGGYGVSKSDVEAAQWYLKAAEQGHKQAQFKIGSMLDMGVAVKSHLKSVEWFKLAADQGDAEAQLALGFKYFDGREIRKNPTETARLWKLSAEQGFDMAQFFWGQLLESGRCGVRKNKKEAIKWFKKAAEQGHADAKAKLRSTGVKF